MLELNERLETLEKYVSPQSITPHKEITKNKFINVNLPKLAEFPTRNRFITAFCFFSNDMCESDKIQYLKFCPELLKEFENKSLKSSTEIISFLRHHPLDVGRAKSSLNCLQWNQKEAPELLFIKIESLIDQAYPDWGENEKFREGIRCFWKSVNKPEWKVEVLRVGNQVNNRVEFLKLIRQIELIDRASKGPLNEVFYTPKQGSNRDLQRCFNCNGVGHFARNCSKNTRKFCMYCGQRWVSNHKCGPRESPNETVENRAENSNPYLH